MTMTIPPTPDDDAMALGMQLAQANALAFVSIVRELDAAARVDFVRSFFACLAGMAEHSIGYHESREVLAFVSALGSAGAIHPVQ